MRLSIAVALLISSSQGIGLNTHQKNVKDSRYVNKGYTAGPDPLADIQPVTFKVGETKDDAKKGGDAKEGGKGDAKQAEAVPGCVHTYDHSHSVSNPPADCYATPEPVKAAEEAATVVPAPEEGKKAEAPAADAKAPAAPAFIQLSDWTNGVSNSPDKFNGQLPEPCTFKDKN